MFDNPYNLQFLTIKLALWLRISYIETAMSSRMINFDQWSALGPAQHGASRERNKVVLWHPISDAATRAWPHNTRPTLIAEFSGSHFPSHYTLFQSMMLRKFEPLSRVSCVLPQRFKSSDRTCPAPRAPWSLVWPWCSQCGGKCGEISQHLDWPNCSQGEFEENMFKKRIGNRIIFSVLFHQLSNSHRFTLLKDLTPSWGHGIRVTGDTVCSPLTWPWPRSPVSCCSPSSVSPRMRRTPGSRTWWPSSGAPRATRATAPATQASVSSRWSGQESCPSSPLDPESLRRRRPRASMALRTMRGKTTFNCHSWIWPRHWMCSSLRLRTKTIETEVNQFNISNVVQLTMRLSLRYFRS